MLAAWLLAGVETCWARRLRPGVKTANRGEYFCTHPDHDGKRYVQVNTWMTEHASRSFESGLSTLRNDTAPGYLFKILYLVWWVWKLPDLYTHWVKLIQTIFLSSSMVFSCRSQNTPHIPLLPQSAASCSLYRSKLHENQRFPLNYEMSHLTRDCHHFISRYITVEKLYYATVRFTFLSVLKQFITKVYNDRESQSSYLNALLTQPTRI